jgi:hypothetical protein
MIRCPACFAASTPGARFCPSCGAAIEARSATPTVTSFGAGPGVPPASASQPAPSMAGRLASGEAMEVARFLPGTVLAGRYRVIGLIGRGGMGEIYRADDLKLGQPVALKFLPESLAHDPAWLARFHDEVRVARQVSHPHVCRVYDIGEVDGQHYFTMEYVDGEDLASLLRRIGRLPRDKAVEIARQLCAGLAAAHDRGVLHRDLKPANVMIDGRGRARLTDFGIAGLVDAREGATGRAGTPAYMAPELLAGGEATVRSDLYALGLVLYETFTGKPAFAAETFADLKRMHQTTVPASPSKILGEIDPVVERVILRCLAKDPADRPNSALAVAAALPGGDPIAAALAAGDTPSPDMVAAAGTDGTLRPAVAWTVFGGMLLSVALVVLLSDKMSVLRRIPFDKPPDVLVERARETLRKAGVEGTPADSAWGFERNDDTLRWLIERNATSPRWAPLAPVPLAVVGFWYRRSPKPLASYELTGEVTPEAPPRDLPGMASVLLDEQGRLDELRIVPSRSGGTGEPGKRPDWDALFGMAGLDRASFVPDPPAWLPPSYADARAAWKGSYPGMPDVPLRVEAAAYLGRPVFFRRIGPWTPADAERAAPNDAAQRFVETLSSILILVGLGFALFVARKNLRSGRGDLRGANRMALALIALYLLLWLFLAHHLSSVADEFTSFLRGAGLALFVGAFVWLLYLALEPAVRKMWPGTLVAWSRLLAGRIRDPLVGRDLLFAGAIGAGLALLDRIHRFVAGEQGEHALRALRESVNALVSLPRFLAHLVNVPTSAVLGPLLMLFLILGLRMLLRKRWLAVTVAGLMYLPFVGAVGGRSALGIAVGVVGIAISLFVLMRMGLHALIVTDVISLLLGSFPLTTDPSAWYAGLSLTAPAIAVAGALYGVLSSTRGARGVERAVLLD